MKASYHWPRHLTSVNRAPDFYGLSALPLGGQPHHFSGLPDFDNDLRRFIGRKMAIFTERTVHVNNHSAKLQPGHRAFYNRLNE